MGIMVEKITLMDAYLIEHIRHAGISDGDIKAKVQHSRAGEFNYVHESFDFTMLHALSDRIDAILNTGYEVRFLTFNGLVNLIELKFQQQKEIDYEIVGYTLSKMKVTSRELQVMKQMVSENWQIREEVDGIIIEPIHLIEGK